MQEFYKMIELCKQNNLKPIVCILPLYPLHYEFLITLEREMSNLILNEIGLIEHQVKTRFAYGIQAVHGDNGLYNPENFKHKREHKQGLFSIQRELERQKKWRTNTSSVPASTWVSLEYATLGAVSRLLNNVRSKEVVQCVSDSFSVRS